MGIYAQAGQAADNEITTLTAQLAAVTAERDELQERLDDLQPEPPPPPPAAGMLVGSDPGTAGTTTALDAKYGGGRKVPIRRFYTSFRAVRGTDTDRPSCVSFKGSPAAVLAGNLDAQITTAAKSCSKDHTTWLCWFHEPEDDIKDGSFTAAQFRDGWKRVAGLVRAAGNPKIRLTPIYMGWTLAQASGRNWLDYYPGDEYVDAIGWDLDGIMPVGGKYPDWSEHLGKIPTLRSKPWIVAEFGAPRDATDPQGTRRAADYTAWLARFRAAGCQAVFLFDYPTSSLAYPLTTAAEIAAWKAEVAENA